MYKYYTKDEIEFIKNNYPSKGSDYCASKLNRTPNAIIKWCVKNNIRVSEKRSRERILQNIKKAHEKSRNKSYDKFNINPEYFLNPKTKEAAYILGLIWADGWIRNEGVGLSNSINISMCSEDLDNLLPIFDKSGKWNKYKISQPNRKIQTKLETQNRVIVEFLIKHNYNNKSGGSPNSIINCIPKDLIHYWFLGLVDGDGCFYFNKYSHQFSIASTYNQDWQFMIDLLDKLGVKKYTIKRREQLKPNGDIHRSSIIRITNINDIVTFGNFIYQNYEFDNIGLLRKFNKFKLIQSKQSKRIVSI
jgi:hypothetical protein